MCEDFINLPPNLNDAFAFSGKMRASGDFSAEIMSFSLRNTPDPARVFCCIGFYIYDMIES